MNTLRTFLVAPLFTATLISCAPDIKEFDTPLAPLNPQFSQTGQQPLNEKWWQAFNDPQLNQLIDTALTKNFNLLAAYNRLEHAQLVTNKSYADLFPSINAGFSGQESFQNSGNQGQFSLGLDLSYEVDLWGRIRANTQAAELDSRALAEDVKTIALSLSTEVATAWYRLIEQRSQLKLLEQQIKTNTDNVKLLTVRFAGAKASAADLFQQQQILEASIGSKAMVEANIRIFIHQLAILTGHSPNLFTAPIQFTLPNLPKKPATGLTTKLIQRRPDLRRRYYRIQAADQRIAAAIADRFPKLSLTANINTNSAPNLQSLFNNWLATLAGNLILPILDGGRRVAEVNKKRTLVKEQLNQYSAQLQTAIKEVEDALIQEQQQQKLTTSLEKQLQLSKKATKQIRTRYMYGNEDFLRVLSIQLSQQALERQSILAQRQLIEFRLQLYRALAGGWSLSPSIIKNQQDTHDG